ncbi:MAG: hypothetical protein R2857_11225 [Vampirovibrionales bacterium]
MDQLGGDVGSHRDRSHHGQVKAKIAVYGVTDVLVAWIGNSSGALHTEAIASSPTARPASSRVPVEKPAAAMGPTGCG